MLCLKIHRQWIYSLLFVLSVAFISLFGLSSDSFAYADITYTVDSSNYSTNHYICQNSNSPSSRCSSFHYLSVSFNFIPSSYNSFNLAQLFYEFDSNSYSAYFNSSSLFYSSGFVYSLSSNVVTFRSTAISDYNAGTFPSGWSITFTLSENNPSSSGPTGNIDITSNGTYDVTNYATATVNVENEVIQGDYHDDLVSINNSILIVAAVGLVIYFFYAIYRMLIGGRK